MKHTRRNAAVALVLLLAIVFGCMFAADRIQRGNGTIAVTEGWIETDVGNLMYKLYTPKTATAENPAPGVLLLHGYQNDHETCAAYAIELARHGAVVLCLDEYGHGSTTAGLINRGYVNHKVTVNYGDDSVEDGTFKTIGGQTRYKVMMNFSNLSFFDKHYTTDADGNSMTDSSAGGSYAYALLAADKRLNFVGNVEAREITHDQADVIVCDGFVGNVILKFMEGVAGTLMGIIKKELLSDTRSKLGALLAKPAFGRVKKAMDYSEVGGAPLLGVRGSVVKAHGSSNGHALACAIGQAVQMVRGGVVEKIEALLPQGGEQPAE